MIRRLGRLGALLPLLMACVTAPVGPNGTTPLQQSKSESPLDPPGPAVVFLRTEPGQFVLNQDYQTPEPAEVLADIKDFDARVTRATLQFEGIPLEIPMEFFKGSTWRALLTQKQLKLLSVNGRTVLYEANVRAEDERGRVGTSHIPIQLSVQAP